MPVPYRDQKKSLVALWLLALAAIALAFASCGRPAIPPGVPGAASGPVKGNFDIQVSVDRLPRLNEPFTVTGKFTPMRADEPDAELWLSVVSLTDPWGIYLDGEDRWHGPLKLSETRTISATFAIVAEGNYTVVAAAHSSAPGVYGEEPAFIRLNITAKSSAFEWKDDNQGGIIVSQGDVPIGSSMVVDSALLLNTSAAPRIEFIQSHDDITRLQEEGLLPKELRYNWRDLARLDFSKVFLIAYFDAMRPVPGYMPVFEGHNLIWDNGILRGRYKTFSVPPEVDRANRPVSSVVIKPLAWEEQPFRVQDYAFRGIRQFEFTVDIDGQLPIVKTVDLRPGSPPTPTPIPSPQPGAAYNFVRLVPSSHLVKWGEIFQVDVTISVGGHQQEISGVQVGISFNPEHLEARSVSLHPASPLKTLAVPAQIDNQAGTIFFVATVNSTDPRPTEGFSLATITFQAKSVNVDTLLTSIEREGPRATKVEAVTTAVNGWPPVPTTLGLSNLIITIEEP